jgi:tetratricopeptide (TPR) repeat protein
LRFWIICATVFVLVALPVLPLQFNGLAIPTWTGPQLADLFSLFIPAAPKKTQTARKPAPPVPTKAAADPLEQVRLMEHAAQDLLVQSSRQPTEPSLHNRLGLIYLGLGELDLAQDHFEHAVELARMTLLGATDRLRSLQNQGKLDEASNQLVESSRLNVELSAAHSNLARLYERKGQHSKVLAELDLLNREGVISETCERPNAGVASAGVHRVTPTVARLLARAEALMQSQRFYEAMQDFKNVIAMDPDVAVAHRDLGVLNAMVSNHQAAVDELETAVRLEPNDALSHNNLGLAYQAAGKLKEAKEHFEHAIASNPRLVDSAINLGNLYASKESYDFSKQVLQQAVLSNPRSAIAHNNLGTVLSLQGNAPGAIEEFRKAIAIQPQMVSAHYGLGLAFFKDKSYRQAIEEFRIALLLNPKLTGVHEKIEQATRKASTSGYSS